MDMSSFEIWDMAHGEGAYRHTGVKKIGAIKELRLGIYEVFGPQSSVLGDRHMVGLKAAKEYVEKIMQQTMPEFDVEMVADCFFLNADAGWLVQNNLDTKSAIKDAVENFYRNRTVPILNDPPVPEVAPVVEMTGQIIGWRTFRYEMQQIGPLSHRWHDFNTVGKTIDTAPDPDVDNEYGFWCFKKKSDLLKYLQNWQGRFGKTSSFLHATVLLTGEVVEHEVGFRAKEIEILGLYSGLNNSQRRGIAHKLGWYGKVLPISEGQEEFPYNLKEV